MTSYLTSRSSILLYQNLLHTVQEEKWGKVASAFNVSKEMSFACCFSLQAQWEDVKLFWNKVGFEKIEKSTQFLEKEVDLVEAEQQVQATKNASHQMNTFIEDIDEKDDNNDVIAIDDVGDLCFEDRYLKNEYKIEDINMSQLFRQYQNTLIKIAKNESLFIESNVHEILSLSSIFLLAPGSHSNMMIDIFGFPLLNEMHQQIAPTRQIELNSECEAKFRKVIKQATKESHYKAINLLLAELSNNRILDENLGSVVLKGLEILPSNKIKNGFTFNENKSRKFKGRAKQPDFVISIVHQFQMVASISVDHTLDFYIIDFINGIYLFYVGQVLVPSSMKEMLIFVDQIEMLLNVQEIFKKSFDTLYDKICNPSILSAKAMYKRDTLSTPKFNWILDVNNIIGSNGGVGNICGGDDISNIGGDYT
ncbi:9613_t:CDS:2 [Funneliformis geosporum]|nr:9613_t:CDS:2 [Funneliformis geosporum]